MVIATSVTNNANPAMERPAVAQLHGIRLNDGFLIQTAWIPAFSHLDSGFQFSGFQMPTIWIPISSILVSTYVCRAVTSYLNRFMS